MQSEASSSGLSAASEPVAGANGTGVAEVAPLIRQSDPSTAPAAVAVVPGVVGELHGLDLALLAELPEMPGRHGLLP